MQFTKIRLSGFKSFADTQELTLEPGLTGIVGPNGCGKSNIVEAIRWVMGETSAKRMRGDSMDDVIFAGSGSDQRAANMNRRPERNFAEVVMTIDNGDHTAPQPYHEQDTLEISRVIEREGGSAFKINNVPVRQRDVQRLFADVTTGYNSTAIVGQGVIGQLVTAKPEDRHALLEEASGILGLSSRRQEAELKLKATTLNLSRVEDILRTLAENLKSLQRQASHARGYKSLNEKIRTLSALAFHQRFEATSAKGMEQEQALRTLENQLADLTQKIAAFNTKQIDLAATLDPLRVEDAEKAARLQRFKIAYQDLDEKESALNTERQNLLQRRTQTVGDTEREQSLNAEYLMQGETLAAEMAELTTAADTGTDNAEQYQQDIAAAQTLVDQLEARFQAMTSEQARRQAEQDALTTQMVDLKEKRAALDARIKRAQAERTALQQTLDDQAREQNLKSNIQLLEQQSVEAAQRLDSLSTELDTLRAERDRARAHLAEAQSFEAELRAKIDALRQMIEQSKAKTADPVVDQVRVNRGYEKALAAAFGDDLLVSTDATKSTYWESVILEAELPTLPERATPLSDVVSVPAVLNRSLSQVGLVDDVITGASLWSKLKPGQRLVTKDGDLWRWDGFYKNAKAKTRGGNELENRAALDAAQEDLTQAGSNTQKARVIFDALAKKCDALDTAESDARKTSQSLYQQLESTQREINRITSQQGEKRELISALTSVIETSERSVLEMDRDTEEKKSQLLALQQIPLNTEESDALKDALREARARLYDAQTVHERLQRLAQERQRRLKQIEKEHAYLADRIAVTAQRLTDLRARQTELDTALQDLDQRPSQFQQQRDDLLNKIKQAELERTDIATRLQYQQNHLTAVDKALKHHEQESAALRETRARIQADMDHLKADLDTLTADVAAQYECTPLQLATVAGLSADDLALPATDVSDKLVKLKARREQYGAVNLMAEEEAAQVEEKITSLQKEKDDLDAATQRLRRAIADINSEGRQRLDESFKKVNAYFEELYEKLFPGGKAYLTLVEDPNDPLRAGLEIMARPPGKRLQNLSLLSGGERSLTAIALLFAVFLTNPAPICVLDEVDAALDDTNVGRFCTLLEETVSRLSTRFLVVTHHRMTMARMNRLYGVTMAEAGVSQLVSVDLERADAMVKRA